MRSLAGVLLAVLLPALGLARQFHGRTDVVHVPVIVTAKNGEPVTGLRREDFVLWEDGRPQRLDFFAEGSPGDILPLHLGLVLDTSESMQRDLPDAATASIRFVNAIPESVDVTLVDFDSVVRVGRFAPPSYPQLFERIRARKASGMTALYDAVGIYVGDATARPGQHVLVVYTDGGDSSSSMTFGKLIDVLRLSNNVIVYAIGYLENQGSSGRLDQQMRLGQLARVTGGDAYFPGSGKQTTGIYERIRKELASRYTLGYVSSNRTFDGRFRKLQVTTALRGGGGLMVRTRPGYYAPRTRE